MAEIVAKRSVSEDGPSVPSIEDDNRHAETLQLRVPTRNATKFGAELRRSLERTGQDLEIQNWPPETPQMKRVVVLAEPDADVRSIASTTSAWTDLGTPRNSSAMKGPAPSMNGDSSAINGPRKLRVSSIVRKISNGETNNEDIGKVRRQPPKLMRKAVPVSNSAVAAT